MRGLNVWWHSLQAYRRKLLRGKSRGALDWCASLERHFEDPDGVAFWLHHYRGPAIEKSFRLRNGHELHVRAGTADRLAVREVLARDIYRLGQFAPGSLGCAIDVGAHIGSFSVAASAVARRVFAFEPVPANFALLERNIAPYPHVKAFNKAVAGKAGSLSMRISTKKTTGHSAFLGAPDGVRDDDAVTVSIEAISLPEFMAEQKIDVLDLLKLDCEGAEYEIVDALASSGALARVRRIHLEYHPHIVNATAEQNGPALASRLRAAGYSVEMIPGEPGAEWGTTYAVR